MADVPTQLAPGVHRLGDGLVNCHLIEDGNRMTLVDAGFPGFRGQLEAYLRSRGSTLSASVSENYGNFVKKYKPSASVLYSNRWHTRLGDMGFLVDLADSRLATRTDGLFVRPFFKNAGGTWVPRGADWRTLLYDRKRDGAYLAFQWRPSNDLDLYATAFQSKYHEVWDEDAIFVSNDPTQVMVDASQPSQINGGVFQSGRLTQNGGMPMGTDIRASNNHSKTTDFTTGMKWRLGTSTEVTSSVQFVKATTNGLDSTVALGTNVPYIDVALNGSSPPHIGVDSAFTGNPANYYWGFTMDHQDQNYAKELAWRADIEHSFDGRVRAGGEGRRAPDQPLCQQHRYRLQLDARVPDLDARLGDARRRLARPGLEQHGQYQPGAPGHVQQLLQGRRRHTRCVLCTAAVDRAGLPGQLQDIHDAAIPYYLAGSGYDVPYKPTLLDAAHTNVQHEKTYAAYAMLDFGVDDANLSGNIGVRAVRTRNAGQGFLVYPNQTLAPYLGAGQSTPISARNQYTDILPSLNVKWEFAPNWITRFAFSKAIARPDFSQMQAYQILNAGVVSGYTPPPGTTVLPIDKLTLTGTFQQQSVPDADEGQPVRSVAGVVLRSGPRRHGLGQPVPQGDKRLFPQRVAVRDVSR